MTDLLQLVLSGVSQGIIYSMLAIAYNITFSSSKTVNFSVGSILMVGAIVGFGLTVDRATGQAFGRTYFIPVLGVMVAGLILGGLVYQFAVRPAVRSRLQFASVLTTLAFAGILRNLVERLWGTEDVKLPSPWGDEVVRIAGAGIYRQEIFYIGIALITVLALELFKKKTILGKAVEAVSDDPETASLMGINQKAVVLFSFFLSSGIAAMTGLMVGPITTVSPTMGVVIGIKAYAVSIIGGLQSAFGTLAGGLILGLSEVLTARYVSSGYKDATGFLILILIVLFRPNGLFGSKTARKV